MTPTAVQREAMRQLAGIYYSAGRNTMLTRVAAGRIPDVVESRSLTFFTADRPAAAPRRRPWWCRGRAARAARA